MKHLKTYENYNTLKLYHGSVKEFPIGFELLPQTDSYVNSEDTKYEEDIIEKYRPLDKLSRKESVFLVDDPDLIEDAGGYDDYIYEVSYDSIPEKSDLAWYTEISMTDDESLIEEYAKNYWSGVKFTNSEYSLFEYRVPKAKTLRIID